MSGARVVKPIAVTEDTLVSTTVTLGTQLWVAGTSYPMDALVELGNRSYKSLVPANLGNVPGATASALKWQDIGPSNPWAMFDNQVSSQSVALSTMTVVIRPQQNINSLCLLNMQAITAHVTVTDGPGGPVVYEYEAEDGTVISNWYEYFFEPYSYIKKIILTDIPPYINAVITITLTGDVVAVGFLSVGTFYDIGEVEYGAGVELKDYSQVSTSKYGVTTYEPGKTARDVSYPVEIKAFDEDRVLDLISSLSGVPCVWIGPRNVLTVFGIYSSMRMTIPYPTTTLYTLTIKGMI